MQVEEVALQNIVLRRADGVRIFFPITKLSVEPVLNVSRSNNRWEGFKVCAAPSKAVPLQINRPCNQLQGEKYSEVRLSEGKKRLNPLLT